MDEEAHWEAVYKTKAADAVSWYSPHLNQSIKFITEALPSKNTQIIDVGGGESTLVDDLIELGYKHLTVLDISQTAIDFCKNRLQNKSSLVHWQTANILTVELSQDAYELWHDRAVFHFLTDESDRQKYVHQVAKSVKPGGHVIVATFGPAGPQKCSGLKTVRYDADSLHNEFGKRFELVKSESEFHQTPFGTSQQFVYCYCKLQ